MIKVRVHEKVADIVFSDHKGLKLLTKDYAKQVYRHDKAKAKAKEAKGQS